MKALLLFCIVSSSLFGGRIDSLLFLGDTEGALTELKPLLEEDPADTHLQSLEILCYAKQKNIRALLNTFSKYQDKNDPKLLEEIAWAIVYKASESCSPIIRQEAFLTSFMASDARGIPLALEALNDPSFEVRCFAMRLAATCRDEVLIKKLLHILESEKAHRLRMEACIALGRMRATDAKKPLLALLESQNADTEEKMAASFALSLITKESDAHLIEQLAASEERGLKLFASELVLNKSNVEMCHLLYPLINDSSFDVRMAALECTHCLGKKPPREAIQKLLSHPDIKTRILANWHFLDEKPSIEEFQRFLLLEDQSLRLFAAGAISHSRCSFPFQSEDPLVSLNLAIGKIWQRKDVEQAAKAVLEVLNDPIRLSKQRIGQITFIGQSIQSHVAGISRVPETEDLLVRLELYSMLATCGVDCKEPLRKFLKERTWGITTESAHLLLQENHLFTDELRKLLSDSSQEIALQAAFILASCAQDQEALSVLKTAYPKASRQMKEYILFAMASIGAKSELSFFVNVLNEPFETLRIVAARGILLSLNK